MLVKKLLKKTLSSWVISCLIFAPHLAGCRKNWTKSEVQAFGLGAEPGGNFVYGIENLENILKDLESNMRRWMECVNWDEKGAECDPTTFNPDNDVEFMRHHLSQLFLAKSVLEDEETPEEIRNEGNLEEINKDIQGVLSYLEPTIKDFEKEYLTKYFGEDPFENQSQWLLGDNEAFARHLNLLSAQDRGRELELHLLLLTKMDPTLVQFDEKSAGASDFIPKFVNKFYPAEIYRCVADSLDIELNINEPNSAIASAVDEICPGSNIGPLSDYGALLQDIFQLGAIQVLADQGYEVEAGELRKKVLNGIPLTEDVLKGVLGVVPASFNDFVPLMIDDIPATLAELPTLLKSFKDSKLGSSTIERIRTLSRSWTSSSSSSSSTASSASSTASSASGTSRRSHRS